MHFPAFWHERLQAIVYESFLHRQEVRWTASGFFRVPRCSNSETLWFWIFRIILSNEEQEEIVFSQLTSIAFKCHLELVTKPLCQGDVKYAMRSSHIHLFTSLKNKHRNASRSNKNKLKHADYHGKHCLQLVLTLLPLFSPYARQFSKQTDEKNPCWAVFSVIFKMADSTNAYVLPTRLVTCTDFWAHEQDTSRRALRWKRFHHVDYTCSVSISCLL